jgi:hypothetical protein
MPRPLLSGAALVLVLACRPSAPEAHRPARAAPAVTSSQEEPDTTPPADVSHGEAPIGGPAAEPAPRLARLEPAERTRLHRVRLEMKHAPVVIAPGVTYAAWTFGGTVPGPVLHVRQGDTVDFTLVNRANIPHSMDFHAAEIAPSRYYTNVMPGDSLHYRFVARVPGAFMYHCGTAPVAMHIANGMYGTLVVDPTTPRPRATELVLVQSEFYLSGKPDQDGNQGLDWQKLLGQAPDHIVFNGLAGNDTIEGRAYREVFRLAQQYRSEILARYPKIMRRVSGYNLDEFIKPQPFNLARMIVGSEGTLATIVEAKMRLVPKPKWTAMDVIHFNDDIEALECAQIVLKTAPYAMESTDKMILNLARGNIEQSRKLGFVQGTPESLLMVEYAGETEAAVRREAESLGADWALFLGRRHDRQHEEELRGNAEPKAWQ